MAYCSNLKPFERMICFHSHYSIIIFTLHASLCVCVLPQAHFCRAVSGGLRAFNEIYREITFAVPHVLSLSHGYLHDHSLTPHTSRFFLPLFFVSILSLSSLYFWSKLSQ